MSSNKMLRLCRRSSKQKRSDTQIGLKTAMAPVERPASFAYSELQDPSQDHLGFPDGVYLLASVVFQNVHLEKPAARKLVNYGNKRSLPLPEVKTGEHRRAYELAFSALKCKCKLNDCGNPLRCYQIFFCIQSLLTAS